MNKGRILLLGGNYFPEPTGIGKYNGEMVDWLSAQGYLCTVLTTYPYYPFWKIQAPYISNTPLYKKECKKQEGGEPISVYRCRHYVPAIPCGKKRVFSDLSFFCSAFFLMINLLFKKKYDYVITVAPPFQLGLLGLLYRKIRGGKLIYHIQDLQIDAAFELGMIKSQLLARVMFGLEKLILKKADYVSSISEGMILKIKAKFNRNIILFPNWSDTDAFRPLDSNESFRLQFNFSPKDKIVLYSGAIGEKQGLQSLLYTAKDLLYRKDIKFIICGSGPYKDKLIDLANEITLPNVFFMPLQPKEQFNEFLNMADVHLVLQKAHANDLVMPSKLTTIFSVGGLALVTAEPGTGLHSVISDHNIGLLIEPENQAALKAAILDAVDQPHMEKKKNARWYAEEYLSIDNVIGRYFSYITSTVKVIPMKRRSLNAPLHVDVVTH